MITFLLYMILIPLAVLTIPFWITVISSMMLLVVILVFTFFLVIVGVSWGLSWWPIIICLIMFSLIHKETKKIRAKKDCS